jgi:mono/diheme cytochrome c family protein
MKNLIKLIFVFLFLAVFGFSLSLRSEASKATPIETKFALMESPRTLFVNNCARCHGGDGKAQTEQGKANDTPDISGGKLRSRSAKRLTNIITNGDGEMPAFGKKLTKAQISSLVNYVRGL